jgi:acyl carrier protein
MQEIDVFVKDFFVEYANIDVTDFPSNTNLIELNLLDSMVWMNLIMQIDEVFNIDVDVEILIENKNFDQICAYIETQVTTLGN